MKQYIDDHNLKDMTVPTVQPGPHQTALRRVLVSRAAQRADDKLTSKGVINFMKKRNIIVSGGVVGALAIAVFAFSAIGTPQNASAMQLAQNSSKALSRLNPQEADYKKFYPYFVDWMNQAQKSKDLRVLSYDQMVKLYPEAAQSNPTNGEPLRVIDNPSDGQKPSVHELKYLAFSVTDGDTKSTVVVGVNGQNIPEAALTHVDQVGKPRIKG
jgi:hypothetical protein